MQLHIRTLGLLLGLLVLLPSQGQTSPVETQQLSPNIYMLVGHGGNVAVSIGADGVFVIDDLYPEQYGAILTAIKSLSDEPVRFLINTHWHGDHTGSNEKMAASGAVIVAHTNVRKRLAHDQTIEFFGSQAPAREASAWPLITFDEALTFHLNGDDIRIAHTANAHTDGDAVIYFQRANILHTGDTFFNGRYPFIDSGTGGSIKGMIAAAEFMLEMTNEETKIIPGHGPLANRSELERYRNMLVATHQAIAALIVGGQTKEQTVLAKPTAAFNADWGNGFLKPDVFVGMIYEDIVRSTLK